MKVFQTAFLTLSFGFGILMLHAEEPTPDNPVDQKVVPINTELEAKLEKAAERFFLDMVDRKNVASSQNYELTDAMRTWMQSGGSKKVGKDIERMFGASGECRKKEILQHGKNARSVELFYSGKIQSFKIRVSFDGTKIAGIHLLPWTDEQRQVGTPIRLETPTGTIHGSLLEPQCKDAEMTPVVLIIAGSGPTDRNGNQPPSLMSNAYLMLAEALQKNGIASIRYDKRSIGASSEAGADETKIRFDDYVDDAVGWIDFLSKEKKYSRIIVAGHSEGSLVGMIACRKSGKADGFISLCGAGRPVDELIREQMERQPKSMRDSLFPILDELKQGKTVESVPKELLPLVRPSVQPYMISWMKYDPQAEMKNMTIPTLIVQGTTDIQVSVTDAEQLAEANPNAKKKIIDNMNHVLKTSSSPFTLFQLSSYADPNSPICDEMVSSVVEFIGETDKKLKVLGERP